MLKTRIIGVLIVKGGIVVQSMDFKRYLPVGNPAVAIDYLNRWGIDEIILLDIDAGPSNRKPRFEDIRTYSRYCQVPLTVGGGITELSDIENLVRCGADKISINTAAVRNPDLIELGAQKFGSQCIVVSMDVRPTGNGGYEVFLNSGKQPTGLSPLELVRMATDKGAGEIFLNAIHRDGSKQGYDLELAGQVADAVDIPVILCGGADHPRHFAAAMRTHVSAVAAANFFHYTEHSAVVLKQYLTNVGLDPRLDTYATYAGFRFTEKGRAAKMDDEQLEKLRFEYIPEEVI